MCQEWQSVHLSRYIRAEPVFVLTAMLNTLCSQLRDAADVLCTQLITNPEDWTALLGYLDCLLPSTSKAAAAPKHGTSQALPSSPRPCASSSLLYFVGGLAERMGRVSLAEASTPAVAEASTADVEAKTAAAMEEARCTIEDMVSAVQKKQGGQEQQQGKGGQVTQRGPHLAKVR